MQTAASESLATKEEHIDSKSNSQWASIQVKTFKFGASTRRRTFDFQPDAESLGANFSFCRFQLASGPEVLVWNMILNI